MKENKNSVRIEVMGALLAKKAREGQPGEMT